MQEKIIRQRRQALQRLVVADGNRLFAEIAAGHHQRLEVIVQKQLMQRRVRQHEAEVLLVRRHRSSQFVVVATAQQNDGPGWLLQQRLFFRRDEAKFFNGREVGRHHRKRLFRTAFAPPQLLHCGFVARIRSEMKTAEAAHRQNFALLQKIHRRANRCISFDFLAMAISQCQRRPASRTGVWLRVKAAIFRIVIFLFTGRTHQKNPHRGVEPVIRNAVNDGITRAAIGAINERILIAAVGGIEKLAPAIRAKAHIRRNQRSRKRVAAAGDDGKHGLPCRRHRFHL